MQLPCNFFLTDFNNHNYLFVNFIVACHSMQPAYIESLSHYKITQLEGRERGVAPEDFLIMREMKESSTDFY